MPIAKPNAMAEYRQIIGANQPQAKTLNAAG